MIASDPVHLYDVASVGVKTGAEDWATSSVDLQLAVDLMCSDIVETGSALD